MSIFAKSDEKIINNMFLICVYVCNISYLFIDFDYKQCVAEGDA